MSSEATPAPSEATPPDYECLLECVRPIFAEQAKALLAMLAPRYNETFIDANTLLARFGAQEPLTTSRAVQAATLEYNLQRAGEQLLVQDKVCADGFVALPVACFLLAELAFAQFKQGNSCRDIMSTWTILMAFQKHLGSS